MYTLRLLKIKKNPAEILAEHNLVASWLVRTCDNIHELVADLYTPN